MKKVLTLLVLICVIAGCKNAGFSKNEDKPEAVAGYVWYISTETENFYYLPSSIKMDDDQICYVWEKFTYLPDAKQVKAFKDNYPNKPQLYKSLGYYAYDGKENRYALLEEICFDKDDNVMYQKSSNYKYWRNIIPNTQIEKIYYDFVSSAYDNQIKKLLKEADQYIENKNKEMGENTVRELHKLANGQQRIIDRWGSSINY